MILGLLTSESQASLRLTNFRRSVLYQYPNGSASLVAFMALLKEETTNDPQFQISEKRHVEQKTITAAVSGGTGSITNTSDSEIADGFNIAAGQEMVPFTTINRLHVADNTMLRAGHILEVRGWPNQAGSATYNLKFLVTATVSTTKVNVQAMEDMSTVAFSGSAADTVGLEVVVIGNSATEGQTGASLAPWNIPLDIVNYTQIWRTAFQFTGTVLKAGLKFDKTGPYADKAKDATLQHAIEMELGFLFGTRTLSTDSVTGLPRRTTGGIEWFLKQWELGNTTNGGAFNYRPGGSAATADTDDNKRIINNSTGTMSLKQYHNYLERLFRVTNNVAQEKLVFCGTGFLQVIHDLYLGKATLNVNVPVKNQWGWDIVSHATPFGTVHYKTHPLFSQNATLRNSALFLDVNNLIYRALDGRDTTLLKMVQPNNADYREDEWRGESGLEVRYPESHMFIKNVLTATP